MVKVTFTSHNKEIYCNKGDKLLDVARDAEIFIDAPCNGNVSCGKCKVRLIKGKVDTEKTHHIRDEEWNQGYILACNTKVIEDIDIEVPSKLSSPMYGMKIEGSDKKKDKEVCEYWSPEYYEERKFTGMLYAYQFCEYKYVAPSYTGTIVSIKTVEMARKVEKEILKEKRKRTEN